MRLRKNQWQHGAVPCGTYKATLTRGRGEGVAGRAWSLFQPRSLWQEVRGLLGTRTEPVRAGRSFRRMVSPQRPPGASPSTQPGPGPWPSGPSPPSSLTSSLASSRASYDSHHHDCCCHPSQAGLRGMLEALTDRPSAEGLGCLPQAVCLLNQGRNPLNNPPNPCSLQSRLYIYIYLYMCYLHINRYIYIYTHL